MPALEIARRRLANQHITQHSYETPQQLVQWLGAVQAQDFAAAKWALGLRLPNLKDTAIEQAFTDGTILRTHVMRPTWHFVSPTDIHWLLALTAPRVHQAMAYHTRKLELDDGAFKQTQAVLENTLQGGKQLTREELASALRQAGIATDGEQRVTYILMRAELDGIICSGARRGKQFTYALLAERAPHPRILSREEALAELTLRYFTGHGPATLQDFVWWSGLTATEAKSGLALTASHLLHETLDGQAYWFSPSAPPAQNFFQAASLLPNYDEYTVGYSDRSTIFDDTYADKLDPRGGLLTHTMLLNGQIIGTWKRSFKKHTCIIEATPFAPLHKAEARAFAEAAHRYEEFLQIPVVSPWQTD